MQTVTAFGTSEDQTEKPYLTHCSLQSKRDGPAKLSPRALLHLHSFLQRHFTHFTLLRNLKHGTDTSFPSVCVFPR